MTLKVSACLDCDIYKIVTGSNLTAITIHYFYVGYLRQAVPKKNVLWQVFNIADCALRCCAFIRIKDSRQCSGCIRIACAHSSVVGEEQAPSIARILRIEYCKSSVWCCVINRNKPSLFISRLAVLEELHLAIAENISVTVLSRQREPNVWWAFKDFCIRFNVDTFLFKPIPSLCNFSIELILPFLLGFDCPLSIYLLTNSLRNFCSLTWVIYLQRFYYFRSCS